MSPTRSADLRVPAEPAATRVVRMLVASVAAGTEMAYDGVEDAALAAVEAFGMLIGLSGARSVSCAILAEETSLSVSMRTRPPVPWPTTRPEWPPALASRVLAGTTRRVEYGRERAEIRFVVGPHAG